MTQIETDPNPYGPWGRLLTRRYAVEYWDNEGDHSFRRFFTKRGARRWAESFPSRFDRPETTGYYDLFRLAEPIKVEPPAQPLQVPRGGIRYVPPPPCVRIEADLPEGTTAESTCVMWDTDIMTGRVVQVTPEHRNRR